MTVRSSPASRATALLFLAPALFLACAAIAAAAPVMRAEQAFHVRAGHGSHGRIRLDFELAPNTHLYRDKIAVMRDGQSIPVATPPGETDDDPAFGRTEIYRHDITATFEAPGSGAVQVRYQGCQDRGICYPPLRRTLDLSTLRFADATSRDAPTSGRQWRQVEPGQGDASPQRPAANDGTASETIAGGSWSLLVLSFAGFGLLLAFTPCVLPMYPILGGMLAREGERLSAGRGFLVSVIYVLAMAVAFGLLGVAAAWSGRNLQIALQSPIAISLIAAVFGLLALSMFGVFSLAVPAPLAGRIAQRTPGRRGSTASAAALGFSSALIVGPCVTPPLAAALVYVAQTGDVARGAGALFALGLGQGIPLIVFGTFGSGLLPKTGQWMEVTKGVFGFFFLGAAVWMLSRIVSQNITMALWAALLITAGVFAGAFDALRPSDGHAPRLGKVAGLLAVLLGTLLAVGAATGSNDLLHPLADLAGATGKQAAGSGGLSSFDKVASVRALDSRLVAAHDAGKPAMVYFTADWCVTCRAIDHDVLAAPTVRQALDNYRRIAVDLTRLDDAKRELMKNLAVAGPPTMLLFPPNDARHPSRRLVGETSATQLAAAARDVARD